MQLIYEKRREVVDAKDGSDSRPWISQFALGCPLAGCVMLSLSLSLSPFPLLPFLFSLFRISSSFFFTSLRSCCELGYHPVHSGDEASLLVGIGCPHQRMLLFVVAVVIITMMMNACVHACGYTPGWLLASWHAGFLGNGWIIY